MTTGTLQTEQAPIDALSTADALRSMHGAQMAALNAMGPALPAIAAAAEAVATALATQHHLYYAAAGSSGLMALADACEWSGTFGIPASQIHIAMAGGIPVSSDMPGDTEDGTAEAIRQAKTLRPGDVALVISASGTTPFALAFLETAQTAGATVIGMANVAGSELLQRADIAIALATPREVVDGSTRLGAGTAQKVALNMISTQAGILLGHVHDGRMVNLRADNIKLRQRARDIVADLAQVSPNQAEKALEASAHDTKTAILVAKGADSAQAQRALTQHQGHLRPCLNALGSALFAHDPNGS